MWLVANVSSILSNLSMKQLHFAPSVHIPLPMSAILLNSIAYLVLFFVSFKHFSSYSLSCSSLNLRVHLGSMYCAGISLTPSCVKTLNMWQHKIPSLVNFAHGIWMHGCQLQLPVQKNFYRIMGFRTGRRDGKRRQRLLLLPLLLKRRGGEVSTGLGWAWVWTGRETAAVCSTEGGLSCGCVQSSQHPPFSYLAHNFFCRHNCENLSLRLRWWVGGWSQVAGHLRPVY